MLRVASRTVSIAFATHLAACAAGVGAAAAQQPAPNNLFTAAGFTVQYADTSEKHAILRRLPPDKLVIRKRGGKTYYLYADPTICRCVYVGTHQAYQAFQTGSDGSQFMSGSDGSQFMSGHGGSNPGQILDEFSEGDTSQPGTTSFNDYVFGGIQDD